MDRRSLLAGVATAAAVGLAGCRSPADADTTPTPQYDLEVTVQNNHDRAYEVRAVMIGSDGSVAFENSFTLGPGEGRGFSDDFRAGEYSLTVELLDRGSMQSYWNTDLCDAHRVRTTIDSDGHVTNDVACLAGD